MDTQDPTQPWPAPMPPRTGGSQMDLWTGIIVVAVFTLLAAAVSMADYTVGAAILVVVGVLVGGAFILHALRKERSADRR